MQYCNLYNVPASCRPKCRLHRALLYSSSTTILMCFYCTWIWTSKWMHVWPDPDNTIRKRTRQSKSLRPFCINQEQSLARQVRSRFRTPPLQRCVVGVAVCGDERAEPGGRSGRRRGRSVHTGTAWPRCAYADASSVRRTERSAIDSHRTNTETAFRLYTVQQEVNGCSPKKIIYIIYIPPSRETSETLRHESREFLTPTQGWG